MQPAGGVDDHDIHTGGAGVGDRIEGHRAGVGPGGRGHDLAAGAPCPTLELLAGRRPESVGPDQQHAVT